MSLKFMETGAVLEWMDGCCDWWFVGTLDLDFLREGRGDELRRVGLVWMTGPGIEAGD